MKPLTAAALGALALVSTTAVAGTPKEEANKKRVVEFYEQVLNQKNVDAINTYLGPYRQHNPQAADGPRHVQSVGHDRQVSGHRRHDHALRATRCRAR